MDAKSSFQTEITEQLFANLLSSDHFKDCNNR